MKGRERSWTQCYSSRPWCGGGLLWDNGEGTGCLRLVAPPCYCHIRSFRCASEPCAGPGLATSRERQLPPGLSMFIMAEGSSPESGGVCRVQQA